MVMEIFNDREKAPQRAPQPRNLDSGLAPLSHTSQDQRRLRHVLSRLAETEGANSRDTLNRLRDELNALEPGITFLGQVKSGKTTLVNALAGWADLLPTDVNPWTSVVTSLHLGPGMQEDRAHASFRFMTAAEWDSLLKRGGRMGEIAGRANAQGEIEQIQTQVQALRDRAKARLGRKFELLMGQSHDYGYVNKELISRYICLGDDPLHPLEPGSDHDAGDAIAALDNGDQGRFADITRTADLYLGTTVMPCKICLRDTPGVNDTFLIREQITLQALRDSRLCVVVLSASQALSSVDMGLIRMLSTMQTEQVILFVNRIDELASPATQLPEIERSLRKTLADHHVPAQVEIIFGSANWASAALTANLEGLSDLSAKALFNWAEAQATPFPADLEPIEMVWELSGLPNLNRAVSTRLVETELRPAIRKIAQQALMLATAQIARNAAQSAPPSTASPPIEASANGQERRKEDAAVGPLDLREQLATFDALCANHLNSCATEIDTLVASFRDRTKRAHDTFVDRATHALVQHLQDWGEDSPWHYDPAGLRLLLRSAYSVLGNRLHASLTTRYAEALGEAVHVLHDCFGSAVEGIQIAVPPPPPLPPATPLAQTIALDIKDNWWGSLWRRTRGYAAFSTTFRGLIAAETKEVMKELNTDLTAQIRADALARLQEALQQQRDILCDFAQAAKTGSDLDALAASTGSRPDPSSPTTPDDDTLQILRDLTD